MVVDTGHNTFKVYYLFRPSHLNKKSPHPRLERWIIHMATYELEIRYNPGLRYYPGKYRCRYALTKIRA